MNIQIIILAIIFITILSIGIYYIYKKGQKDNPYTPVTITCPNGQKWDPKTQTCIPYSPPPPNCPSGQKWDPKTQTCVPYTPPPPNCPNGQKLDPKTNQCVDIPCPNGQVRDKKTGNCIIPCNGHGQMVNSQCECDINYTGDNCQCDIRNINPNDITDLCRGIGNPICNEDGTWSRNNAESCTDIYKNNGGTETQWENKCYDEICSSMSNDRMWKLKCDNSTKGFVSCEPQCLTQPRPGDCQCNINTQTCVCDGAPDSNYKWVCRDIEKSACSTSPPNSLCDIGDAICISCGKDKYYWHCNNSNDYDKTCTIMDLKLKPYTVMPTNPGYKDGDITWYWNNGSVNGIQNPVLPTINNDICDSRIAKGVSSYSDPQINNNDVSGIVNSQDGFVKNLSWDDSGNPQYNFYVNDINDKNIIVYNVNQSTYNCSNGEGSVYPKCFDGKNFSQPTSGGLCKDGDISTSVTQICPGGKVTGLNLADINMAMIDASYDVKNHSYHENASGCMKLPTDYCNAKGTFKQYCFDQGGILTDCDNTSVYFKDDGGTCDCNEYRDSNGNIYKYQGSMCQYDNSYCNNKGIVSSDDNDLPVCQCNTTYAGNICQFNNSYCNNNGSVFVDNMQNPSCQCDSNYYGVTCEKEFDTNTKEQYISDVASWLSQMAQWKQKLSNLYNPSNSQIITDKITFNTNMVVYGYPGAMRIINGHDQTCFTDWYLDGTGRIVSNKQCYSN